MRGGPIQKFIVVIRRLDTDATGDVVDGGFDDVFGSVKRVDDGTQMGATSRREKDAVSVVCQIDRKPQIGQKELERNGYQDGTVMDFIIAREDLENAGYIKPNGEADFHAGDRIESLRGIAGNTVMTFDGPGQMFVRENLLEGYGLAAFGEPLPNLVVLRCAPNEVGR